MIPKSNNYAVSDNRIVIAKGTRRAMYKLRDKLTKAHGLGRFELWYSTAKQVGERIGAAADF